MKCQILFSGKNKNDISLTFHRKHNLTFHVNCLYPLETVCMKCQILFSGKKNKKNISKCRQL